MLWVEDGDINESIGFENVIDAKERKAGYLALVDGVRISITGGVISWSIAS